MAKVKDVANIFNNVRELDLRPIRAAAEKPLEIVLAGKPGSGRDAFAARLQIDPSRPDAGAFGRIITGSLAADQLSPNADLYIVLVSAGESNPAQEQDLARNLGRLSKTVLVLINRVSDPPQGQVTAGLGDWGSARLLYGSADDLGFIQKDFIPTVLDLLPDSHLALGRQYPLFRVPIARKLINDTSTSNAAYSFTTGLAEIIPGLGVPLNVTDMVILTKAQAFLVYRLGLVFGFSTEWRDYVAEFGSVIGGGFVWRQLARQLVGLIPIWGIVPKVAVAYAGTYVVGGAILQWYLTGRHVTRAQMRELYAQSLARGKAFALALRRKKEPRLKAGKEKPERVRRLPSGRRKACPNCGKINPAEANFCQACGTALASSV